MRSKLLLIVIAIAVVLTACGKKEHVEAKNMEQIHREQGVPVTIEVVQPQNFVQELSYTAKLEPMRRTVEGAFLGGKVQAVRARVGDFVERDQILVEFEEDNPASQYQQAKASYELAKATYQKMQALYEVGGISELELDQVRTQYEVAEATINDVTKMIKPQAPFSGVLTAMDVRVGDGVESGDPLFTVAQVNQMRAKLYVPEDDVSMLSRGQKVVATWRDLTFIGKVDQIAYDLNREMQGYAVDIIFNNPQNVYRSGMTAEIKLDVYTNDAAIVAPRKLVQSDENGSYVYVDNGGNASKRYVKTGATSQLDVEIVSGLNAGDRLLATGWNLVTDGAKLMINR